MRSKASEIRLAKVTVREDWFDNVTKKRQEAEPKRAEWEARRFHKRCP